MIELASMPTFSVPLRVDLALTRQCNLRCRYCYFFSSGNEVAHELSTAEWQGVIDELAEMKVLRLLLSGGEALLRKDFPVLLEHIRRRSLRFTLLSNGWSLEEPQAEMLKNSGRCDSVQISLDGLETVHDLARGKGSFTRAIRAIRALRRHGVRTKVRITVGSHNFRSLPETVRFLVEELQIPDVSCNLAVQYSDRDDASPAEGLLSLREELEAAVAVSELKKRYPRNFYTRDSVFAHFSRFWPGMIRAHREKLSPRDWSTYRRCPVQDERLYIRADGAVTPCSHLSETVLGYAGRDSLTGIWRNSPVLARMRNPGFDARDYPRCMECEYRFYCRPGADCHSAEGRMTRFCLRNYREAAPDFDFGEMKWKNGH